MKRLEMFGFPVDFDPSDAKLVPAAPGVSFEAYNRKYSKGMLGLLADADYAKEDEPYYDFYKAIGLDADRAKFEAMDLRYDSTVILDGTAGDEYKKTAGHFHCQIPGKGMSYPEYYQVIQGKALFVMQRVKDEDAAGAMEVEEAILAEVEAGQAIVVPPAYGHCTVNIGEGPLVFVNLVSCHSENAYEGVKRSTGMCCYIKQAPGGGYRVEKNPAYVFPGEPRIVTPLESDRLGIYPNAPVYTEYLRTPEKFSYLYAPENHVRDFLAALADKQ